MPLHCHPCSALRRHWTCLRLLPVRPHRLQLRTLHLLLLPPCLALLPQHRHAAGAPETIQSYHWPFEHPLPRPLPWLQLQDTRLTRTMTRFGCFHQSCAIAARPFAAPMQTSGSTTTPARSTCSVNNSEVFHKVTCLTVPACAKMLACCFV